LTGLGPIFQTQVKKIDIEAMPRSEEKEMFKDYMEEFNTATLPHRWAAVFSFSPALHSVGTA
jgi:hypothetical protein